MPITPQRHSLIPALLCLALIAASFTTGIFTSAQTLTAFNSSTPFSIPAYNATVYFALDGTYNEASLENDTWVFKGLCFSDTVTLKEFNVSAHDCNVTLYFSGLFRGYLKAQDSGLLQYNVTGTGLQRFNFGLSPSFAINQKYRDLMVRFSSEFFTNSSEVARQGEGWQLAADGTVTVTGASTGASIRYVDYSNINNTSLPFYLQHWVTITAVTLMLAIVAAGLLIRFKLHRSSRPEDQF